MSFDEVYISEIIKAFFEHRNDRVSLIKIDKQRKKILLDIGEYEIICVSAPHLNFFWKMFRSSVGTNMKPFK
jgi:hypothetical protein